MLLISLLLFSSVCCLLLLPSLQPPMLVLLICPLPSMAISTCTGLPLRMAAYTVGICSPALQHPYKAQQATCNSGSGISTLAVYNTSDCSGPAAGFHNWDLNFCSLSIVQCTAQLPAPPANAVLFELYSDSSCQQDSPGPSVAG